jgi:histone acetyltransferase
MEGTTRPLEFAIVHNDRKSENMIQLLHLRNLFSKALVKMPRDYVVRMIFDRRHMTYAMYREDGSIVGGLCFRPFADRGFAEVVFLAIAQGEQVKGRGTRLMNHFKEYCKHELGIHYLLTYADNFAIGYFKKQGFTADITLPTVQWKGYIKDYDGGTMMGCRMYQHIDYRDISGSVREVIKEVCKNLQKSAGEGIVVYPGLLEGFPRNIHEIPGLEHCASAGRDDGWSAKTGTFQGQVASLLQAVLKEPFSLPFREPVSDKLVPGYSSVITNPMDLSTMIMKNNERWYSTRDQLRADVKLMIENCVLFNGPRHEVTRLGNETVNFLYSRIDKLVEFAVDNSDVRDSKKPRIYEHFVVFVLDSNTRPVALNLVL